MDGAVHRDNDKELFERLCSLENLFLAWGRFCLGKRGKIDVMAYERRLEDNLAFLQDELANGAYRHSAYIPFTIFDPKQRRIHKATVKDRIVHQAVVNVIEPLFEPRFIFDSYSCRVGKGVHNGMARLRTLLRRASRNNSRTVYILKCDIKRFFDSVDHAILRELIQRYVHDPQVIALTDRIIDSFPHTPGKGIPLGNLTSQLFANIYLHELDWYLKQIRREKHYLRYCDDFIILSQSRPYLVECILQLNRFLQKTLALELHPSKVVIHTWHQGVDFLGWVHWPDHRVLRTTTKKRMFRRVREYPTNEILQSYAGLLSHGNTSLLQKELWSWYWLWE